MAETIIMKGALEDHLGRIIYPDTEADQVMTEDGKTVKEKLADLLANFSKYMPLTGGTFSGPIGTDKTITVNQWGGVSAGTDGIVVFAENAYKHPTKNTYHFARSHASMGARGIVLSPNTAGVWYFDTGKIAATQDAEFTPTLISITDKATKRFTGDLNDITENMLVDGLNVANAPSDDWYYVVHLAHSQIPSNYGTQIAFAFHSTSVLRRQKVNGVWGNWEPFMTQSNTPTQYYSTVAPTAADGKDGDVWDVIE